MSIYDKLSRDELKAVEQYMEMSSFLKKKRSDGLVSMFSSTQDRFFRFFCYCRFLTYYEKEPSMTEPPKNVMFVDEIERVEANIDGNKNNFIIKLKNGKDVNLKHDDFKVAERWVECLQKVINIYKGKSMLDFEVDRKWKDKVDIRVTYMIMEELERESFTKIKQSFVFDKQLTAKGLFSSIQQLSEAMKKSRFMFGMTKHSTTKPQEHEKGDQDFGEQVANRISNVASIGKNMFSAGLNFILPNNLFFDNLFYVLCTSKSYLDDSHTDKQLLKSSEIPHWMEMDTIYFFKYDDEQDKSEFIEKVQCKDVKVIEPVDTSEGNIKSRYCYRFELQDKVHIMCHDHAIEVNNWIRCIRSAKKTQEEVLRTEKNELRKNVNSLVWSYRQKRGGDVQAWIKSEFESIKPKNEETDSAIQHLQQLHENYVDILDSLQAYRPFYDELFKLVMKTYHMSWWESVRQWYNKNYKNLGAIQIITIADLLMRQCDKNEKYGMVELRFNRAFNDLLSTYFVRTYKNIMPLALEVLQKMTKECDREKDVCFSFGPVDLFKFLNETIDHCMACLSPTVLKGALNLIAK